MQERIQEQVEQMQASRSLLRQKYMFKEGVQACSRGEQHSDVHVGQ